MLDLRVWCPIGEFKQLVSIDGDMLLTTFGISLLKRRLGLFVRPLVKVYFLVSDMSEPALYVQAARLFS